MIEGHWDEVEKSIARGYADDYNKYELQKRFIFLFALG